MNEYLGNEELHETEKFYISKIQTVMSYVLIENDKMYVVFLFAQS